VRKSRYAALNGSVQKFDKFRRAGRRKPETDHLRTTHQGLFEFFGRVSAKLFITSISD